MYAILFQSSFEANTWLSTGWFTMVAAMDICQEIVVYGMAHEDFCQNATYVYS